MVFKTLPISTNAMYATFKGRRITTRRGRENKEAIAWEARAQWKGPPLSGPLKVSVALYWPTKRNHDIDNIKVLLDSLTGIVWEDDGQIVDLHTTKAYDKDNPRVEISVDNTP